MVLPLRPVFEKLVQLLDVDEQVIGLANLRLDARKRADRVDQVGRTIMGAALVAAIAVLTGRFALGTGPLDEPVGQERAGLGVVELRHLPLFHQSGLAQGGPNLDADLPRLGAIGTAIVVELDAETGKVGHVGLLHLGDQFLLADALLPGADHDGRAVGVVGAYVDAPAARGASESGPRCPFADTPRGGPMWMWPLAYGRALVTRICLLVMNSFSGDCQRQL